MHLKMLSSKWRPFANVLIDIQLAVWHNCVISPEIQIDTIDVFWGFHLS